MAFGSGDFLILSIKSLATNNFPSGNFLFLLGGFLGNKVQTHCYFARVKGDYKNDSFVVKPS